MFMTRNSLLVSLLLAGGCTAQGYQGGYSQSTDQPYVAEPYVVSAPVPVYQNYNYPTNVPTPFAYDRGFPTDAREFNGGSETGYGRRQYEQRGGPNDRSGHREEQQLQQRETQQLQQQQDLYNSHVRDLQTQHNQGVAALQQQFNQGRINKDQLNNGYRQLEQQMNGAIINEQQALPR